MINPTRTFRAAAQALAALDPMLGEAVRNLALFDAAFHASSKGAAPRHLVITSAMTEHQTLQTAWDQDSWTLPESASAHQKLERTHLLAAVKLAATTGCAHLSTVLQSLARKHKGHPEWRQPRARITVAADGSSTFFLSPTHRMHTQMGVSLANSATILRLAWSVKGIGAGPRWTLNISGHEDVYVRAKTARAALAWVVATKLHNLPTWAAQPQAWIGSQPPYTKRKVFMYREVPNTMNLLARLAGTP